jgi:hypothetical protein
MKVYKKLIDARIKLQATELTKSGHNKFAGYKYFELGDFLPAVQSIFKEVGLVDAISFTEEIATMVVYDVEDGSSVTFTSPMGSAQLKGCHMVQNIGAVETYQRRYLYTTALAIVEHDALDAVTGSAPVEVKPVAQKIEPVPKKIDDDLEPLAEVLITFGDTCEDLKELSSFWKKNQAGIDRMKSQKPELFKTVQEAFAQYKVKFKE